MALFIYVTSASQNNLDEENEPMLLPVNSGKTWEPDPGERQNQTYETHFNSANKI